MEGSGVCGSGQAYTPLEVAHMTPTSEYPSERKIGRQPIPIASRFHPRVDKTPGQGPRGDCWEWVGARNRQGYGKCWLDGKNILAHRVAYLLENGAIDDSLMILHSCDNPPCCNPGHLREGTVTDNMQDCVDRRRQSNARKTRCNEGHEFTPENTRINSASGSRICITCYRAYMRMWHRRRKDKSNAVPERP